jgi:hypothetical protein
VFFPYRQAAGSGDVVIQKRYFAIDDTCAPVTATPFRVTLDMNSFHSHIDQISQLGHHQEACPPISPGLHRIDLSQQSL